VVEKYVLKMKRARGVTMNQLIIRGIFACWLAQAAVSLSLVTPTHAQTAGAKTFKYEEPACLTASIYSKTDPDHLLFKFKRAVTRSGSTLKVQRDFSYPDGRIADREWVTYEGDALLMYELEELQTGSGGTAQLRYATANPVRGSINFEYAKEPVGHPKTRTETLVQNTLVGDMVGPFLADHWETLLRGEKVKCRYIVIARRETVGFTFIKDAESTWQGHHVLLAKMEPSSSLIAALVEPLVFTLEMAPPHRVLKYVGRTVPKAQLDGKWKDQDVVTVFDWDSAR
jgi:hypothetical protein